VRRRSVRAAPWQVPLYIGTERYIRPQWAFSMPQWEDEPDYYFAQGR
jgi:hypothetical protein